MLDLGISGTSVSASTRSPGGPAKQRARLNSGGPNNGPTTRSNTSNMIIGGSGIIPSSIKPSPAGMKQSPAAPGGGGNKQAPPTSSGTTSSTSNSPGKQQRFAAPKEWTPALEDKFRLKASGWSSEEEYEKVYGPIQRWNRNECVHEFISKLQLKSNGFFVYWKKERECSVHDLKKMRVVVE